jgi:hypothetical protein
MQLINLPSKKGSHSLQPRGKNISYSWLSWDYSLVKPLSFAMQYFSEAAELNP